MADREFKSAISSAKDEYFANADAALARHKLAEPSLDSFRKLIAAGKKTRKNQTKKAAG
jgi:hypothetical protein